MLNADFRDGLIALRPAAAALALARRLNVANRR